MKHNNGFGLSSKATVSTVSLYSIYWAAFSSTELIPHGCAAVQAVPLVWKKRLLT